MRVKQLFELVAFGMLTTGCSTLLSGHPPQQFLAVAPDSARIVAPSLTDSVRGSIIRRARPPARETYLLSAPGFYPDSVTVRRHLDSRIFLNLVNPVGIGLALRAKSPALLAVNLIGGVADLVSGAAWRRSPERITIQLRPLPPLEMADDTVLPDSLLGVVLLRLATLTDQSGCVAAIGSAWRAEADLYLPPDRALPKLTPEADSAMTAHVQALSQDIQRTCSTRNPLLDSLRATESAVAQLRLQSDQDPTRAIRTIDFLFPFGKSFVRDTARVRDLARALTSTSAYRLELHGTADPSGSDTFNQALSRKRAQRVRDALLSAGASTRACCDVVAHGRDVEWQVVPGASRNMRGADLNRRVTFRWRPIVTPIEGGVQ